DRSASFSGMLAFCADLLTATVVASDGDQGQDATVLMVSGTYFSTLGIDASEGRTFGSEVDAARLANPIALVSHGFFERRLNGNPQALGKPIRIGRNTFSVVGVLPRSFTGLVVGQDPEIYVPVTMQPALMRGQDWLTQRPGVATRAMFLHVIGRLKPG